jgi:hypothetical protein
MLQLLSDLQHRPNEAVKTRASLPCWRRDRGPENAAAGAEALRPEPGLPLLCVCLHFVCVCPSLVPVAGSVVCVLFAGGSAKGKGKGKGQRLLPFGRQLARPRASSTTATHTNVFKFERHRGTLQTIHLAFALPLVPSSLVHTRELRFDRGGSCTGRGSSLPRGRQERATDGEHAVRRQWIQRKCTAAAHVLRAQHARSSLAAAASAGRCGRCPQIHDADATRGYSCDHSILAVALVALITLAAPTTAIVAPSASARCLAVGLALAGVDGSSRN